MSQNVWLRMFSGSNPAAFSAVSQSPKEPNALVIEVLMLACALKVSSEDACALFVNLLLRRTQRDKAAGIAI